MAGPAPKTRNWTARENVHKPSGLHLIVDGAVQVTNTNQRPRLTESAERNPRHLGLALTIEQGSEPGLEVICWKQAYLHKEVKANEYDSVTIRWDVSAIAQVPVVDDREHAKLASARMVALNAAAAKASNTKKPAAPKKAAAKKAAPKKAAPKKAAPKKAKKAAAKKAVAARVVRAVGGWAKGAKKALKRVMGTKKKAPKKAAKKAKSKKKKR